VTFWRTVVRFQAEKIAPLLAARNTLGIALPLAAGVALGSVPAALIATIGALNVSYSDSYDPYLQRARRMVASSVLVGVAVFAGALCGHYNGVAVLAAGAWAFAAGLLVALSTSAADLGVISLVTLVVFTARPLPLKQAALSVALALAGGLFQTVLALAFWPVRRHVPERRALASLYSELSRAAASPLQVFEAPPASAQSTQAQAALAPLGDFSIDSERYRFLLSQAERARVTLFSLARLRIRIEREGPTSPERALLDRYLATASRILKSIGDALPEGQVTSAPPAELEVLQVLTDDLRPQHEAESDRSEWTATLNDAGFQMDALTGQLRSAIDLTASAAPAGMDAFVLRELRMPWRLRLHGTWATLHANLSLRSAACRHAVRLSACVALGDAFARSFELRRSYWLPMTIAIVLKPDFTATFSRGVLRLAGTYAGLIFATALFLVLPATPAAEVAAIVALVFVLRCWGPANYGILATAVTGLIVLLVAMTGVSPKDVIAARGLNTTLGGAVALLAYWLWPTWERNQAPEIMARMLDAYRDYFRSIRDSYSAPEEAHELQLDRARLAARLGRSNLEASLERMSAEPGASPAIAGVLGSMLASSHRLIHAIMALEAGLSSSRPAPAREAFRHFANDVELTLYYLAQALRGSPLTRAALPDLREDHRQLEQSGDSLAERYALVNVETDRITNSLNTLSEEILRWLGDPANRYV
jgi:uncharacterized membrane protein YccC